MRCAFPYLQQSLTFSHNTCSLSAVKALLHRVPIIGTAMSVHKDINQILNRVRYEHVGI